MKLGIVIAVRNEARTLPALLTTLAEQPGIESVAMLAIVDGRSDDDSRAIAEGFRDRLPTLRVIDNEQVITPVAFNLGVEACLAAGCDAVQILSAHSWIAKDFIRNLLGILETSQADVIGSVHEFAAPRSAREAAAQAFTESRLGRRAERYRLMQQPTETDVAFCPAIRRRVFEKIGLFDPRMVRNQDNDFTTRARAAGFRIETHPALRYTYVARQSLRQLCRQMKGNGYWVGFRPRVHNVRHFAPSLFWGAAFIAIVVAAIAGGWFWLLPAALLVMYFGAVLFETLIWSRRIGSAALLLPQYFTACHLSYAAGTLLGAVSTRKE